MNNSFPAAMISNSVSLFKSPLLNHDSAYDFIHRFIFLHKWAIYLFILLMGFDYFRFERVNQDSFVLFPYSSVLWVTVMIVSLQSFLCLKKKSLSDDLSFTIFSLLLFSLFLQLFPFYLLRNCFEQFLYFQIKFLTLLSIPEADETSSPFLLFHI